MGPVWGFMVAEGGEINSPDVGRVKMDELSGPPLASLVHDVIKVISKSFQ